MQSITDLKNLTSESVVSFYHIRDFIAAYITVVIDLSRPGCCRSVVAKRLTLRALKTWRPGAAVPHLWCDCAPVDHTSETLNALATVWMMRFGSTGSSNGRNRSVLWRPIPLSMVFRLILSKPAHGSSTFQFADIPLNFLGNEFQYFIGHFFSALSAFALKMARRVSSSGG